MKKKYSARQPVTYYSKSSIVYSKSELLSNQKYKIHSKSGEEIQWTFKKWDFLRLSQKVGKIEFAQKK